MTTDQPSAAAYKCVEALQREQAFRVYNPYQARIYASIIDAHMAEERAVTSELVEALRPFAAMADQYDNRGGTRPTHDTDTIVGVNYIGRMDDITVGALRLARAAIAKATQE